MLNGKQMRSPLKYICVPCSMESKDEDDQSDKDKVMIYDMMQIW